MALSFSAEAEKKLEGILSRYPNKEAALLPALYLAQDEFGYMSPEAEEYVAGKLGIPPMKVHCVASFYTMYNKKPVGKYHVQVCRNISCTLLGAEHVVYYIGNKLGIGVGETTTDRKFTLSEAECLGSCGTAPMMQINDDYYEELTEKKIDEILAGLE